MDDKEKPTLPNESNEEPILTPDSDIDPTADSVSEPIIDDSELETPEAATEDVSEETSSGPSLSAVPEIEEEPEVSTELKTEEVSTTGSVNFNTISSTQESPEPSEPMSSFAPAPEPKKKKGKGSSALMLLMLLITLCGVGFGVYGFFFQEPKTITKTIEVPGECPEEKEETASSADYIYIGEWGIKIKKPEGIKNMGYSFGNIKNAPIDINDLLITGIPSDANISKAPSFAQIDGIHGLITISRRKAGECTPSEENPLECPPTNIKIDDYEYIVHTPQALISTDQADTSLEEKAVNILAPALKNPESYSKF